MNKFLQNTDLIKLISVALLILVTSTGCGNVGTNPNVSELVGTSWIITSLNEAPLIEGTQITISFEDGKLTGSSGCNIYGSPYTATNTMITANGVNNSTKLCELPEGIMQQEEIYLDAFSEPLTYEIEDNHLTLTNGKLVMKFSSLSE